MLETALSSALMEGTIRTAEPSRVMKEQRVGSWDRRARMSRTVRRPTVKLDGEQRLGERIVERDQNERSE